MRQSETDSDTMTLIFAWISTSSAGRGLNKMKNITKSRVAREICRDYLEAIVGHHRFPSPWPYPINLDGYLSEVKNFAIEQQGHPSAAQRAALNKWARSYWVGYHSER